MARLVALPVALVVLLPGRGAGQTYVGPEYVPEAAHPVPLWLSPPNEAGVASCTVDTGISLVWLGQAGTAINAAVKSCENRVNDQDTAACAASVSGVVAGFGYAAGFLSQAAADCQRSFQVVNNAAVAQAACAADISNFVASLALLAEAGSSIHDTCGKDESMVSPDDDLAFNSRRLEEVPFHKITRQWTNFSSVVRGLSKKNEKHNKDIIKFKGGGLDRLFGSHRHKKDGNHKTEIHEFARAPGQYTNEQLNDRAAEIAECVFDVGQATLYFARAALMINAAVADCSRFELRTSGRPAHMLCAVDVASVISAFAFVSSGISYAAFHCPFWTTLAPACAGSISNIIAALAQIAASGASFEGTCGYKGTPPVARRLSGAPERPDVLV